MLPQYIAVLSTAVIIFTFSFFTKFCLPWSQDIPRPPGGMLKERWRRMRWLGHLGQQPLMLSGDPGPGSSKYCTGVWSVDNLAANRVSPHTHTVAVSGCSSISPHVPAPCAPSIPRVAVAQYTLIAVTHHRDTAPPAILLHHILAWGGKKLFYCLCLILAKLSFNWLKSVFSSYFVRSPLPKAHNICELQNRRCTTAAARPHYTLHCTIASDP